MQLPSDEQQVALITRIAGGDAAALGEFATLTGPWVVAALARMLDDPDLVVDLTERTFIELWQTAPLWDRHVGRPLLWALAVARTLALETLTERRRDRGSGPGTHPPADPGAARDESCAVGSVLAQDPAGREILEALWFSHPVDDTSSALPDGDAATTALVSFTARLGGGSNGG